MVETGRMMALGKALLVLSRANEREWVYSVLDNDIDCMHLKQISLNILLTN